MNWITLSWPMAISACITMALLHLHTGLSCGDRRLCWSYLFFTSSALAVACVGIFELALMFTHDIGMYRSLMRWSELPISVMLISLAGFIWCFFGTGRRWMAVSVVVTTLLVLVLNLTGEGLTIRHARDIYLARSFGGVTYTLADIENGPLTALEVLAAFLLVAFVVDAAVSLSKKGNRRRAVWIGGSIVFFILATRMYALLIECGLITTPYFFVFPFLALLAAMGSELSTDIIRAVNLSKQLQESEHRMDLAARAATLGFWVWDIARDDIWATDGARELFGFPKHEPINFERFAERLNSDDCESMRKDVARSLETGCEYGAEYRIRSGQGQERWISARGRPEAGANGNPGLMRGVVMDVTLKRQSEIEIDNLRRKFSHLSRVALAGELAGSLAHELNQPLAAILSNAQAGLRFMNSGKATDTEIREILVDIVSDDKRAGDVIRSLRGLMRKDSLQSVPVDIRGLIESVVTIMHSEAVLRGMTIETTVPQTLPKVLGDRTQLQQVLLNLLINAADSMEQTANAMRKTLIDVSADVILNVVTISVRDNGHGIAGDMLSNIFEPFHSTKGKGMGMGLSISRTIVQTHNGRIWAVNNPDGGATFFLELPVINEESDGD